jgi:DMSO/TMAO reductase YedYZ molybdopterin-dependent catalytic subunit
MSEISRRRMVALGIGGASLLPPDSGGIFGLGKVLNYASHRLLTRHTMAREFPRSQISRDPFANETMPPNDDFKRLEAGGFLDWRLKVDGMVANPASFSLADLRRLPTHSQITQHICEEGWSYIAEWTGAPLIELLKAVEALPQARFVAYFAIDGVWWDSIDMADALHPQTLVTYAMNGGDLPIRFGGPLRLRVPRQLGYKSVKFITRLTVTDSLKKFGAGQGSPGPEFGYSWYAGI